MEESMTKGKQIWWRL